MWLAGSQQSSRLTCLQRMGELPRLTVHCFNLRTCSRSQACMCLSEASLKSNHLRNCSRVQGGGRGQAAWSILHGQWAYTGSGLTLKNFSCTGMASSDHVRVREELRFTFTASCPRLGFGPRGHWIEHIGWYELGSQLEAREPCNYNSTLWNCGASSLLQRMSRG